MFWNGAPGEVQRKKIDKSCIQSLDNMYTARRDHTTKVWAFRKFFPIHLFVYTLYNVVRVPKSTASD